jgi:hypothetical protein
MEHSKDWVQGYFIIISSPFLPEYFISSHYVLHTKRTALSKPAHWKPNLQSGFESQDWEFWGPLPWGWQLVYNFPWPGPSVVFGTCLPFTVYLCMFSNLQSSYFDQCRLNAHCVPLGLFMSVTSCHPLTNSQWVKSVMCPSHGWGNWGLERWGKWAKVGS